MSKIVIIGDSFFTQIKKDTWLTQCFQREEYKDIEVVNLANGGTGFDRQWHNLVSLKYRPDLADIKYCIVGWSSPHRLHDPSEKRDWSLFNLDTEWGTDKQSNNYEQKRQALKTLVALDTFNKDNIMYDKAKALLQWTDNYIYNTEEYSHIKFINFYCVYDKQHQIVFENAITVKPSLNEFVIKKYNKPYLDEPNHFPMFEHHYMAEFLHKVIQGNRKLWHLI